MSRYMSVYAGIVLESSTLCRYFDGDLTQYRLSRQAEPDWEPGSRPVNSTVRPLRNRAQPFSHFNLSEYEVFAHHTTSAAHSGDSNGDRLLEWATNPKFKGERVRYVRMQTMGRNAVKLNIPGGVLQKDLSEPADHDCAQRMVFFYRSLYDAVKQLL